MPFFPSPSSCSPSGFGTYPGRKRGALHPQIVTFPCPACQGDVELGERGLNGLFRNLTLERVVERYRQSVSVGGAILCQLCKPPPLEATKGCTECRATFCNECFKLYHPWGTQKAQHEPTLPTLTFRPKVSRPCQSDLQVPLQRLKKLGEREVLNSIMLAPVQCFHAGTLGMWATRFFSTQRITRQSVRRLDIYRKIHA